jgi:hypothetical protein
MTSYPYPHPQGNGVTIVGRDAVGLVAVSADLPGFGYYLTDCCLASAKGGEHGVICRACYRPVDDALGGVVAL